MLGRKTVKKDDVDPVIHEFSSVVQKGAKLIIHSGGLLLNTGPQQAERQDTEGDIHNGGCNRPAENEEVIAQVFRLGGRKGTR